MFAVVCCISSRTQNEVDPTGLGSSVCSETVSCHYCHGATGIPAAASQASAQGDPHKINNVNVRRREIERQSRLILGAFEIISAFFRAPMTNGVNVSVTASGVESDFRL